MINAVRGVQSTVEILYRRYNAFMSTEFLLGIESRKKIVDKIPDLENNLCNQKIYLNNSNKQSSDSNEDKIQAKTENKLNKKKSLDHNEDDTKNKLNKKKSVGSDEDDVQNKPNKKKSSSCSEDDVQVKTKNKSNKKKSSSCSEDDIQINIKKLSSSIKDDVQVNPKKHRHVSEAKKKNVAGKQFFKCANQPGSKIKGLTRYNCPLWEKNGDNKGCFDESGYDIDHIVEHSITADDSIDNLQALCKSCHSVKTKRFMIK